MTVSPQGNLYAALQLVPSSNLGNQTPGLAVFPIDPNSGQLGQPILVNSNLHEDSLALNPGATVLFDGEGVPPPASLKARKSAPMAPRWRRSRSQS